MSKIKINPKNKGKFTAWAKSHDMSVQQAAAMILRNRERYSPTLIKRANFARNASKWEEGGEVLTIGITENKKRKKTGPITVDDLPGYGLGGNIFNTVGGALATAVGTGLIATGIGAPVGAALAGAGVGMVGKGISGFEEDAAAKRQAKANELAQAQSLATTGQTNLATPLTPTFKFGGTFKGKRFGKSMDNANALVMDGEIIMSPDGKVDKASNPGAAVADNIPLELADQTKIISRENSKPLLSTVKKLNKTQKLATGGVTGLTKRSIDMNVNKYYERLFDAYNTQELQKFDGGGISSVKYVAPDNVDLGLPDWNTTYGGTLNDWQDPLGTTKFSNPADNPFLDSYKAPTFDNTTKAQSYANTAMELAPTMYNLGQGLFGKRERLAEKNYRNPYEGKINSLLANSTYNINPELSANESSFRTALYNNRNLGGSRGRTAANSRSAMLGKQFADAASYQGKNISDIEAASRYAQALYPLGRDRAMTAMTLDEGNLMTNAAGRNMIGAGLTGLEKRRLVKQQMANQTARDRMLAESIRSYSPYTDTWLPSLKEWMIKNKQV